MGVRSVSANSSAVRIGSCSTYTNKHLRECKASCTTEHPTRTQGNGGSPRIPDEADCPQVSSQKRANCRQKISGSNTPFISLRFVEHRASKRCCSDFSALGHRTRTRAGAHSLSLILAKSNIPTYPFSSFLAFRPLSPF